MGIVLVHSRPALRRAWVAAALALFLGACSPPGGGDGGRLRVVAAFYPLAEAASRVGGGAVEVVNLTPPGVEPHDLELSPQQIADIQGADVVLYVGSGYAPSVERAAADAEGVTLDVLAGAGLDTGTDPHAWLDPVVYRGMVARIADAMIEASPEDEAAFSRNAAAFEEALRALDRGFREGLDGCERRLIVTAHAAFGHLAERYGLEQEPIAGIAPDAEPNPERLAELAELVRREGVTTVFTETLVSPRVAETLAREAGVRTAVLDPLEGLTEDAIEAGDDYVTVMRRNLATLREALGCP